MKFTNRTDARPPLLFNQGFNEETETNARLDITFFNQYAEPQVSSIDYFIGGYSGSDAMSTVGNSFTFGRVLDTGTGINLPDSSYQENTYVHARRLYLGGGNQQPGVYYCEATANNGETERLHTVVIRADADIKPESHTKTVSWGEDVTLSMTTSIQESSLRWKHNGNDKPEWNGLKTITIRYAETSDGGVYECYSSESQRSQGKHGMMKLIVNECPNGKHGENCTLSCPTCYNGGVCNATIGECICPPGFQGTNCQTACGKNAWGAECDRLCSSANSDSCRGKMFCLADPYGCSCSTSYTDLDCQADCPTGMYGAGCTQTCHCTSGCNAAIGCPAASTCESGWSGTYCNIPDSCPDGFYGDLCNYNCHCKDNAACDQNTGVCPNGECAPGWITLNSNECQGKGVPMIVTFFNNKVNPGEETSFICKSYGNPGPGSNEIHVQLLGSSSWSSANDIQEESSYLYAAIFTGITVNANEQYICVLQISQFDSSSKTINVDLYDLPRFASTNTPTVMVEATQTTISWQKWDESTDIGDGPVEAYRVYYKQTGENNWTLYQHFTVQNPSKTSYSTIITGLQWSTSYDFTVTVKRPGPKGEGSKDTYITAITLCDEPSVGPSIISATSTDPNEMQINIQVPSSSEIKCNYGGTDGYIESFVIRYRQANSGDSYEEQHELNGTSRSFIIYGLIAYTEYEIGSLFNNKDEQSPWSLAYTERTAEDVPSEPRNVTLSAGVYTIDVQWLIPEPVNGVINQYIIKYWEVGDQNKEMLSVTEDLQDINTYQIPGLKFDVSYSVQVGAATGAGLGDFSDVTTTRTTETVPGMPESLQVKEITDSSVDLAWKEPAIFSGDIKHYGVEYFSGESVFTNTEVEAKSFLVDANVYSFTLTNLSAGTTYEIKVNASTSKGFGEPNIINTGTTFTVDVSEELSFSEDQSEPRSITDSTVVVTLPQLSEDTTLSSDSTLLDYVIVVEYDEISAKRRKREVDPDQLSSYNNSNLPYYITASIPLADLPDTFIIGDGGVYGGYFNAPLIRGIHYYIYYGFESYVTGETFYTLDNEPRTSFKAGGSASGTSSPIGAIIGGILAALLIVGILIGVVFYKRRLNSRQKEKYTQEAPIPCTEMEQNDVNAEQGEIPQYVNTMSNSRFGHDKVVNLESENPYEPIQSDSDESTSTYISLDKTTRLLDTTIAVANIKRVFEKLTAIKFKNKKTPLQSEWEKLNEESPQPKPAECKNGRLPKNMKKNRYMDILPIDKYRPKLLTSVRNTNTTDYINASFVDAYTRKDAFLVTQMPLPDTVVDFWRMVYDHKSYTIVMLNDMDNKTNVDGQYWPSTSVQHYGPFEVEMLSTKKTDNIICRVFQLSLDNNESILIKQFQLLIWPSDVENQTFKQAIIEVMEMVEKWQNQSGKGPVTVHCLNGIGRSGVYCAAVSACERAKEEQIVDVFQAVKTARMKRPKMVETMDEYQLCYEVVVQYCDVKFPAYENFPK
ncbi:receptor-type tyrosine-protein phosphatase F-like [Glandiceps talaboti]